MKLNKNKLKSIIVESLKNLGADDIDPRYEMTGTGYDDVRAGMESEPQPEDFGMPEDIAGYFRGIGDELRQRIEAYDQMPSMQQSGMTPEDVKAALDEMDRVQNDLEEIKKILADLEKRDMRGED